MKKKKEPAVSTSPVQVMMDALRKLSRPRTDVERDVFRYVMAIEGTDEEYRFKYSDFRRKRGYEDEMWRQFLDGLEYGLSPKCKLDVGVNADGYPFAEGLDMGRQLQLERKAESEREP